MLKYYLRCNTSSQNVNYVDEIFGIQFYILKYIDFIESRVFSEAGNICMYALQHCQSYCSNILQNQWQKAGAISCSLFPAKLLLLCYCAFCSPCCLFHFALWDGRNHWNGRSVIVTDSREQRASDTWLADIILKQIINGVQYENIFASTVTVARKGRKRRQTLRVVMITKRRSGFCKWKESFITLTQC